MKSLKKVLCLTFCLLLCLTFILIIVSSAITVFADSPSPRTSYKIELENGTKFFYMRGMEADSEDDENFLDLESGLYFSDTLENIYTVEPVIYYGKTYQRYVYQSDIIISQDGMYFSSLPWTTNQGICAFGKSGTAIEFYKNGALIKTYNLSDLTKNKLKFEYSVSHVSWENRNERKLDETNNTLTVKTLNNKTIVFDLTNGSIISKKLSGGEIAWIIIISLLIALVSAAAAYVTLGETAGKVTLRATAKSKNEVSADLVIWIE